VLKNYYLFYDNLLDKHRSFAIGKETKSRFWNGMAVDSGSTTSVLKKIISVGLNPSAELILR